MDLPQQETSGFRLVDIKVPRDRKGEFEPEFVKKASISREIEEKILSMYELRV